VFTYHKNNEFEKKLITQNMDIWIWAPQLSFWLRHCFTGTHFSMVFYGWAALWLTFCLIG
jgi:hypothetical protein